MAPRSSKPALQILTVPASDVLPGDRFRETDDDEFVLVERVVTGQSWVGESLADTVTVYFDGGYCQMLADQPVFVERAPVTGQSEAAE